MLVEEYEVYHMMGLRRAKVNFRGKSLVLLGGRNGHGKTRAINALLMALCGKSGTDWPEVELADDDRDGWVTVKLTGDETGELQDDNGFTIEMSLKRRRGKPVMESIRVLDSTGEESPEPRTLLQKLYQLRALDPFALERAKPAERVKIIKELVGLDFSELDSDRERVYKERTEVNRDSKMLAGQRAAIEFPEDTPDETISVVALVGGKEAALAHNRKVDEQAKRLTQMQSNDVKFEEDINKLAERLQVLAEAQLENFKAIEAQQKLVTEAVKIDTNAFDHDIKGSERINGLVILKQQAKRLDVSIRKLQTESQSLTTQIERIDRTKQVRMETAKWPLPNMSLDDAGVLLDGLPFEQASTAQRFVASIRVGIALNPTLKLFVCKHGNDLDDETLALIESLLEETGYQMLLEFVTRTESDEARCAVVFKDGTQKGLIEEPEDSE